MSGNQASGRRTTDGGKSKSKKGGGKFPAKFKMAPGIGKI